MYVELGKIVGVWGVKGWVKLHSYTRNRADISQYSTWYLSLSRDKGQPSADLKPINVLKCREQAQGVVAQLDGVADRDVALAMSGQFIWVKEADLPDLPDGEFYWQQLLGLKVSNSESVIGTVASILETGANDVLVIKPSEQGQAEVLIPYTEQAVIEIDISGGTMLVDWDPSYLVD